MTTEQGTIASVDAVPLGASFVTAGSIGDTVLHVDDVSDFYAGTRVSVNGLIYTYDPAALDDTASTITITSPLTAATAIGDIVWVWDIASTGPSIVVEAAVIAQGSDNTGDTIMARVDAGVLPFLPLGPRDPANQADAEDVTITDRNGVWWVTAIIGRGTNQINEGTITGSTIQTAPPGGLRMWMQSQDPDGGGFEGLYLSSGLAAEDQPGHLILTWDTPVGAPPDGTTGSVDFSIVPPQISSPPNPAYIVLNQSLVGALLSMLTINADSLALYGGGSTNLVGIQIVASGIMLNAGTPIKAHGHGTVGSATTDPSGNVVVTHGMGVTPISVSPTAFVASNGIGVRLAAKTSTTFTLCFYDTSTKAALGSTNVGFTWDAFA